VDSFGFLYSDLGQEFGDIHAFQPVYVLRAPIFERVPLSNGGVAAVLLSVGVTQPLHPATSAFQKWTGSVKSLISANLQERLLASGRVSSSKQLWKYFPGDVAETR
jgi:hypothetical protein